jgi:hypothetical protein
MSGADVQQTSHNTPVHLPMAPCQPAKCNLGKAHLLMSTGSEAPLACIQQCASKQSDAVKRPSAAAHKRRNSILEQTGTCTQAYMGRPLRAAKAIIKIA